MVLSNYAGGSASENYIFIAQPFCGQRSKERCNSTWQVDTRWLNGDNQSVALPLNVTFLFILIVCLNPSAIQEGTVATLPVSYSLSFQNYI